MLSAIFVELGLIILDLASINLAQKRHVLGMQHGGEEFRVQGWMTETPLEFVVLVVGSFGMDLGQTDFFLSWNEVSECGDENAVDVDLEGDNEEDGRDGGHPDECPEALLETDGEYHQCLHEGNAE